MKPTVNDGVGLLLLAILPGWGMAVEVVPQCPVEVGGSVVQVQPVKPGWRGIVSSRLVLERATIVAGPPDVVARAELRGDELRVGKGQTKIIYSGLDVPSEKWLVCAYGQGQDIEQAVRLPGSVRRCDITISQNREHNQNEILVSCQ